MKNNQKGFSLIEAILVFAIIAALGGVGWFVYQSKNKTNQSLDKSAKAQNEPQKTPYGTDKSSQKETTQYLNITELKIRFKLTENTKDAYYHVSSNKDPNGIPYVYLSTHSLDAYAGCQASVDNSGVAAVGSFHDGESDEIVGDYLTAYPAAQKVNDLRYYIQGNQYDCTEQNKSDLYTQVRKDFISQYKTIEKLPN